MPNGSWGEAAVETESETIIVDADYDPFTCLLSSQSSAICLPFVVIFIVIIVVVATVGIANEYRLPLMSASHGLRAWVVG